MNPVGNSLHFNQVQELADGTALKGAGGGDLKLDIPKRDIRLKDAKLTGAITFGSDTERSTQKKLFDLFSNFAKSIGLKANVQAFLLPHLRKSLKDTVVTDQGRIQGTGLVHAARIAKDAAHMKTMAACGLDAEGNQLKTLKEMFKGAAPDAIGSRPSLFTQRAKTSALPGYS